MIQIEQQEMQENNFYKKNKNKNGVFFMGHLQEIQYKHQINNLDQILQNLQKFLLQTQKSFLQQQNQRGSKVVQQQAVQNYCVVDYLFGFLQKIKQNIRQLVLTKEQQKQSYQNLINHKEKKIKNLKKKLQIKNLQFFSINADEFFDKIEQGKASYQTTDSIKCREQSQSKIDNQNVQILKNIQLKFKRKFQKFQDQKKNNQNIDIEFQENDAEIQSQYFVDMKIKNKKRISLLRKYLNSFILKDNEKLNDIKSQKQNNFLTKKLKLIISMNNILEMSEHLNKNKQKNYSTQDIKSKNFIQLQKYLEIFKKQNQNIGQIIQQNVKKILFSKKIFKNTYNQLYIQEIFKTIIKNLIDNHNKKEKNLQNFQIFTQKSIDAQSYLENLNDEELSLRQQLYEIDLKSQKQNFSEKFVQDFIKQKFDSYSDKFLFNRMFKDTTTTFIKQFTKF